jgi:hypothetical protein
MNLFTGEWEDQQWAASSILQGVRVGAHWVAFFCIIIAVT